MSEDTITRVSVFYSGRVQGVGFRYTVFQVAKGYEVTGYVQNLTDGRVLLAAEGASAEVDAFVAAVADRLVGYIRKTERHDESGPRMHKGFGIR